MSKKKAIITIIFVAILAIFALSNNSYAYKPSTFFPIQEGGYVYFCREKGQALRLYNKDTYTIMSGPESYSSDLPKSAYTLAGIHQIIAQRIEEQRQIIYQKFENLVNLGYAGYRVPASSYNNGLYWDVGNVMNDIYIDFNISEVFNKEFFTSDTAERPDPDSGHGFAEEVQKRKYVTIQGPYVAEVPDYVVTRDVTVNNTVNAYIMSAGKNWVPTSYNQSNYAAGVSDKSSISDKQDALWLHQKDEWGETYNIGQSYSTSNTGLYNEAYAYKKFYEANIKNNAYSNKVSISLKNPTAPNVIVNKNNGTITVGPYVAYYPDDARFSFIENMYVKDQNGNKIAINRVISEDGKAYPSSGKAFFVEISSKTNPTSVTLGLDLAYLKNTNAVYQELEEASAPKVLRILGQIGFVGSYKYYYTPEEHINGEYTSGQLKGRYEGIEDGKRYNLNRTNVYSIVYNDLLLTIDNKFTGVTYDAQDAARLVSFSREWTKVSKEVDKTSVVDISIDVSGNVFVDEPSGKEGKVDGIYTQGGKDKPMSGMTVHLFSKNSGKEIASTKTDKNGKYEFKKLSAVDSYYVKFDYNGQYYEPTYYTKPSTSGKYKYTSNGTDYVTDRNTLNARFSAISSSPANYNGLAGYNKTYSKKDLLGYTLNSNGEYVKTNPAVIDEFGNLIIGITSNAELQKKIQFVKDCQMSSWTKSNGSNTLNAADDKMDYYPSSNVLILTQNYDKLTHTLQSTDVKTNTVNTKSYATTTSTIGGAIEDKSQYINQGYKLRQEVDLSLKEDVHSASIQINGKTQEYLYDSRQASTENDAKWEIAVRLSDGYYNTQYSRELYPSDYQFKATSYDDPTKYGKTKDDELKVYVTYKVYVRNQSMSVRTKVDEIVHYYDSEYEYVADKSYIEITRGSNKGKYDVRGSNTSRYASLTGTTTNLNGYQSLYITGLDGIYLDAGQSANIYLTFVIEKDVKDGEEWVKLDEDVQTANPIGVGKESISEINGYSTVYKTGTEIPNVGNTAANTLAGLVDVDSNPGNLNPTDVPKDGKINYHNFEDDTDKAPNIRLVLYRDENSARIISGFVWEDARTQTINNQATATGNGIREAGEKLINGVTVELVEIMENGTEYVWRTYENGSGTAVKTSPIINVSNIIKDHEFTGDKTGTYAFKSFVPGNYIVRFKYGDTVKTVLAKDSDATKLLINEYGLSNELKALLNDTSYNGQDYKSTIYQAGLGTYNAVNVSKGYNYDIAKGDTALVSDAKDLYAIRENVVKYSNGQITNAFAELLDSYQNVPTYNGGKYSKDMMKALLNEFIAKTSMVAETGIIGMEIEYNKNEDFAYHLANLDLGLQERPKAQIEINKDVKNLKITLANGNILFDATQSTDNLLWQPNTMYGSYTNFVMEPSKFGTLDNIRTQRTFGLVQPTMDQELMHGATVRITYEITAKNIGEVDYKEEQFYYTGVVKDKNTIVTTNAVKVVDYIPNNLQYYAADNSAYWQVVRVDELINSGLVNANLKNSLEKFNTIVVSDKTSANLVPAVYKEKVDSSKQDSVSIPLVLTQLITSENKTADLTYNNIVELVVQSNTAGRKMEYSVPGNQDPTEKISELDADMQKTSILPPFGAVLTYILIAILLVAGAAIIAGGIIFIKKKVLTK